MTIGQKLHQCRNEAGLSQEEVAGRLLVSRQTISLWETDQTLPTIDNLLRLKELFGISVDELLTGEEQKPAQQSAPDADIIESFSYAPTAEDVKKVTRRLKRKDRPRYLLLLPMLFMWVVLIGDAPDALTGFVFGILFVGLFACICQSIRLRKRLRESEKKALSAQYVYELTDNRLYIRTEREGVASRFCFEQGEVKCTELDEVFGLDTKHGIFTVGREALCGAPRILSFIKSPSPSEKAVPQKTKKAVKAASILLLINACLSFALVAALIGLSEAVSMPPVFVWLAPLVPLVCLLFGIAMIKRGFATRANIIIGAIFTVITLIFCLLFTAHLKSKRGAEEIMTDLSQKYSVTLPASAEVLGMDDINGDDRCRLTSGRLSMASLGLDGSGKKAYFSGDERWIQGLPEELAPYVPEQFRTAKDSDAHYILIDCDSGLVNTPPDGPGHSFVLFYVPEYSYTIYAAEYTIMNNED